MKPKPNDKVRASEGKVSQRQINRLKAEWPLLIYPVLIVAALAILYGVNQSLQRELTPTSRTRVEPSTRETPTHRPDRPEPAGPADASVETNQEPAAATGLNTPVAGGDPDQGNALPADVEWENLQGAARTLAMLRAALMTGDQAQIKQCMDELVALGDEAVGPLSEVILTGSDATTTWAARALARIGTPTASGVLLESVAQTTDGAYKNQLVKEASNIRNHDSWPTLLNALQDAIDPGVQRAAEASLAQIADKPVVDEIVARYDAAATEEEADRLAKLVGNISSPAAGEALLALAGKVSSAPRDSLEAAAIEALANIGDAQSVGYLLSKLEATPPGEGADLFGTITSIHRPEAEAALQYAAAGSKDVSAEHGRTAAIYALENYPNAQTYALLEQIVAAEENAKVVSAAARTLDRMTNAEPMVAANAASGTYDAPLLPVDPLKK